MAKSSSQSEAIDKLIQKLNLIKTGFFNNIKNANNQLEEELRINVTTEKFSDIVAKSKEILDKLINFSRSVISGKTKIANAITEKGVQTDSNGSFENMSENIKKIKTGYSVGENLSSDKVRYKTDYKYKVFQTINLNSKALCVSMKGSISFYFGCQDGSVNKGNVFHGGYTNLYNHSDYVRDIKVKGDSLISAGDDHKVCHYNLYDNRMKWETDGLSGYVLKLGVGSTRIWAGTNDGHLYAINCIDGEYSGSDYFTDGNGIIDISIRDGDNGFYVYIRDSKTKSVKTMSYDDEAGRGAEALVSHTSSTKIISPWNLYHFLGSPGIYYSVLGESLTLSGLEEYNFKEVYCSDYYKNEYVYAMKDRKAYIVKIKPELGSKQIQISELVEPNLNYFSVWAMDVFDDYLCLSVQENTQQKIKIYKLEKTESFEIIK